MRRNGIVLATLASLALASSAWAALPFGRFGGLVNGGNGVNGVVGLQGWALDDNGVRAVDILVDGVVIGRAAYGRSRPGVLAMYPGYPNAAGAGFAYFLDTTHFQNGLHSVQPRVTSVTGERALLNAKVFQFFNDTHSLVPFGHIDYPQPHAELFGRCNLGSPRLYSVVDGYALDVGVQPEDTGVGYVELMIDRALWSNSRTGCYNSTPTGGLSDCYGLERLDVERFYPGVKDAPHSGFRFVIDVGALIGFGFYNEGAHLFTVRAGDHADQDANIDEIPVVFRCAEDEPNHGSIGEIEFPVKAVLTGGTITIKGWALDLEGVLAVDVYIDGSFVGQATYGLPSPATVKSRHPSYVGSAFAGYSLNFDTTTISNGKHSIQVKVRDYLLVDHLIGEFDFWVANWNG